MNQNLRFYPNRKKSKINLTQMYQKDNQHSSRKINNNFGTFIYKDHVTMRKYQMNNLKSHRRTKTLEQHQSTKNNQIKQMDYFLEELKIFNTIKSIRKQQLIQNKKKKKDNNIQNNQIILLNKSKQIDSMKISIRKQVDQFNKRLLREYLLENKPYSITFGQLNKISNLGALSLKKILEIRKSIQECHQDHSQKQKQKQRGLKILNQIGRQKISQQYDDYFNKISAKFNEQISKKVKSQALYKWAGIG